MLEEFLRRSALFDFYGALLTEKQQRCLSMHLFDDYSLSEIGEVLGISRQAVHDMLRRSEQAMENFEARLGLLARRDAERKILAKVYDGLRVLPSADAAAKDELLRMLAPLTGLEDKK
ncbi:MAG: YlxM family DNA-binding protein [Schwartzia sp.]|nr:YlxM family DNA-binding protein [Schwartzia sp. (in: firmicutes)]